VEEFFVSSLKEKQNITCQNNPNAGLNEAMRIKRELEDEGVSFNRYRALVPFAPWGRLIPEKIKPPHINTVEDEYSNSKLTPSENKNNESGNTDKEESDRSRYMSTKEEIDEEACEDGLILNIYDKILSWAEFVNISRPFDDDPDEESDKKADQLEELSTAETERSAGGSFNADLEREAAPIEEPTETRAPGAQIFTYPEWDYRKKIMRDDYSHLSEVYADVVESDFVSKVLQEKRGLIKDIRRKFELITPDTQSVSRQTDGENIDIDAAVEALVNMKSGKEAGEKLYISSKRIERDLSTLFLVDLSMSTDAWVKDKRIIDHEKEALVILCEAMEVLGDRYAIYGFSGKTRTNCKYFTIKGFDEKYNEEVRKRIGSLIPYQYTRMGPAIRHSTHILNKESSRAKLLFIISDGKPNDMDAYEGRYGVEDTRGAIRESERKSITPFCLTIDSKSGEYLPRIFGAGNYAALNSVEKLTKKLPELYARIVRQL
jgi:nitric oxide reductase NorD protein